MQAEDASGRLHAIGRVDSKEGANIIVVQFYLSAESQSGHPDGLQRFACDSHPAAKPMQGTGCSVLVMDNQLNTQVWSSQCFADSLRHRPAEQDVL